MSLLTAEILAIIGACGGALFISWFIPTFDIGPSFPQISGDQLRAVIPELSVVAGMALTFMILHGHYTRRLPFWTELRAIVEISLFALLATGFMEFAFRGNHSRHLLVGTWLLFTGMSVVARRITKQLLAHAGLWRIKVLVISDSGVTDDSYSVLEADRLLGYHIVGLMTSDQIASSRDSTYFRNLLETHDASHLVLAINFSSEASKRIVKDVARERVAFSLISQLPGIPVFGFEQVAFFGHDAIMLSYCKSLAQPLAWTTKMVFDVLVSSLLLVLFAGPMAIIALIIKMDGGPVLFAHERVGAGGRTFNCLKFRTMCTNAEDALRQHLESDAAARVQWAQTRKLTRDPRVTPIGRFLRASSLDELPQLLNILRREMSLVGPRPIVRQEIHRYNEDIAYYYDTKPGLTGLWQVSGRSDTTYSQRVKLDSWYVRNWSVWHDIAIMLKTIPAVFGRVGAR